MYESPINIHELCTSASLSISTHANIHGSLSDFFIETASLRSAPLGAHRGVVRQSNTDKASISPIPTARRETSAHRCQEEKPPRAPSSSAAIQRCPCIVTDAHGGT